MRRLVTTGSSREIWERRSGSDQQRVLEWFSALSEDEARSLFSLLMRLHTHLQPGTDHKSESLQIDA